MRRRIWSETLPYANIREVEVLALLRRYSLGLLLAVRPSDLAGVRDVVSACTDSGVEVGLWPMIDDARGRWASSQNAAEFCAFVAQVLEALQPHAPCEVVVDLEPGIEDVRALIDGSMRYTLRSEARGVGRLIVAASDTDAFADARRRYTDLAAGLRGRGIQANAVVVPLVLLGDEWETLMGTPVEGPEWGAVSTMLYTSIVEGWSRGLLNREDAVAILAAGCRATVARYGTRAGVSLGTVGTGAFGDEPVYRDATELAHDVSIARACGVDDLTLFDLGGVLARSAPEPWLDAFVETAASDEIQTGTLRGRAAISFLGATALLGLAAGRAAGAVIPLLRRYENYRRTGTGTGSR